MRSPKLGDVYAFHTHRGYRIIQWAYSIENQGEFVKVFPKFYAQIPTKTEKIVTGDYSYIIRFDAPAAYYKGLFIWIKNYPLTNRHHFSDYDYDYRYYESGTLFEEHRIPTPQIRGVRDRLANQCRMIKTVNAFVDPIWFIYLISSDFDFDHRDLFEPGSLWYEYENEYGEILYSDLDTTNSRRYPATYITG